MKYTIVLGQNQFLTHCHNWQDISSRAERSASLGDDFCAFREALIPFPAAGKLGTGRLKPITESDGNWVSNESYILMSPRTSEEVWLSSYTTECTSSVFTFLPVKKPPTEWMSQAVLHVKSSVLFCKCSLLLAHLELHFLSSHRRVPLQYTVLEITKGFTAPTHTTHVCTSELFEVCVCVCVDHSYNAKGFFVSSPAGAWAVSFMKWQLVVPCFPGLQWRRSST